MKKSTFWSALALCFLFAFNTSIQAQELLYEVPMSQKIQASTQIVEGKVVSKQSFWDANQHNIYTTNTVEVYKVFKGQSANTVEIITRGGNVGADFEEVHPSLQLKVGDIGVFTLNDNTVPFASENSSTANRYAAYSGPQGFYKYNMFDNSVSAPFYNKQGITSAFYGNIVGITNAAYTEILPFDIDSIISSSNRTQRGGATITSFTPTTATAGTKTVMTINGVGFGATQQNVGFANANSGGANFTIALQTQILSWSDTQITVEIPSLAGTGPIGIIDNPPTALLAQSSSNLTVTYSQINFTSDFTTTGTDFAYDTQHYGMDGNGGYTWQMFTDFDADAAASASFIRAMDTWRCTGGTTVNWKIGAVTAVDAAIADNINIIRFDNGSELDAGVLGVCTTRGSGCSTGGGTPEFFVTELDIVFDDAQSWEFGPANATGANFDFETVAVHELGHGHQLGHVIDASKIMHFAVGPATTNRVLHPDDLAGAGDVFNRSITTARCSQPLMTAFDCSTLSTNDVALEEGISIFPNPANNNLYIKNGSYINLKDASIYDVSGRLVSKIDIDQNSSLQTLNVSNLSNGMYFITVNTENASLTKKFIIE